MPKSTVTEENPHALPLDTYFPAILKSVVEKRFPIRKGERAGQEFVKWTWDFEISAGEYKGLHSSADSDPRISVFPDGQRNAPAQWIEAIRDLPVDFGEAIDTDDYVGLACVITVRHDERDRGDGAGKFYSEPIKDVFPWSLWESLASGVPDASGAVRAEDPPF